MRESSGDYKSVNFIIGADFDIVLTAVARIFDHYIRQVSHTKGDLPQHRFNVLNDRLVVSA